MMIDNRDYEICTSLRNRFSITSFVSKNKCLFCGYKQIKENFTDLETRKKDHLLSFKDLIDLKRYSIIIFIIKINFLSHIS